VQAFLNGQLAAGQSIRSAQIMKTVLSSALTRAMREELIMRNVAHLAGLPTWERRLITPWTAAEARAFLDAAVDDLNRPGESGDSTLIEPTLPHCPSDFYRTAFPV